MIRIGGRFDESNAKVITDSEYDMLPPEIKSTLYRVTYYREDGRVYLVGECESIEDIDSNDEYIIEEAKHSKPLVEEVKCLKPLWEYDDIDKANEFCEELRKRIADGSSPRGKALRYLADVIECAIDELNEADEDELDESDFEKSVKDESKQDIIIEAYASIGLLEADEWKITIQLLHRLVCELERKIKGD